MRVTPVVAIRTVTTHSATKPPSSEVQVMVALPTLLPVTTPFSSTVATLLSEVFQVTFLFEAYEGTNSGVSVKVLSTYTAFVAGMLRPSTG